MIDILRDPIWQGLGVLVGILLGFVGFYHTQKQKIWLYLASIVIVLVVSGSIGAGLQRKSPAQAQASLHYTPQETAKSSVVTSIDSILSGVTAYKTPDETGDRNFKSVLSLKLNPFGELGYALDYSFPINKTRSYCAGLSLFITKMRDISEYSKLNMTISADADVPFAIAINDTEGKQNEYAATGIGRDQNISIPIKTTFTSINLKTVFGIHFIACTDMKSPQGSHHIFISDLKFIK